MQNFKEFNISKNFILDSLPTTDYEWLQPRLKHVKLQQGTVLHSAKAAIADAYFPTTCLLSWTNSTEMGETVEIGMTGCEGVSGISLLFNENLSPWRTEVQLAGDALKLSAEDFLMALERSTVLRQRVAAFAYLKLVQLNQSALCNRFHSAEERLCRWLLSAQDHTQMIEFPLTQEILAEMIGTGRPTVSLVTGVLQSAGLVRANRGTITILNREGMEDAACECYRIVGEALKRYLEKRI